jgi:hypothetical protein
VLGGDVVYELHYQNGLADAGAAEEPYLPALQVRCQEVNDLDAGLEDLHRGRLLVEGGRRTVYGVGLFVLDRPPLVDRLPQDVQYPPERALSNGHGNACARVQGIGPADKTLGRVHRYASYPVLADMLRDLGHKVPLLVAYARVGDLYGVVYGRQPARRELYVEHRPDYLGYPACCGFFHLSGPPLGSKT